MHPLWAEETLKHLSVYKSKKYQFQAWNGVYFLWIPHLCGILCERFVCCVKDAALNRRACGGRRWTEFSLSCAERRPRPKPAQTLRHLWCLSITYPISHKWPPISSQIHTPHFWCFVWNCCGADQPCAAHEGLSLRFPEDIHEELHLSFPTKRMSKHEQEDLNCFIINFLFWILVFQKLKNDWNFGTIDFHSICFFSTMEVNGAKQLFCSNRSSRYLPLSSSEERNSYRFATTWE